MPASTLATDLPPLLRTARLGRPFRALGATASTNADALRWADNGAPEGALVTAEHQTAGRGRHGRAWADADGHNLLASLVLRPTLPADRLGLLPLAAGVAVADAVASATGLDARLKWPNDVLVGGRKVCGLLLESRLAPGRPATVVLGLGLNVNQTDFPPEVGDRATSLALEIGRPVPRAPLLAALLAAFEARYDALHRDGGASALAAFEARMVGRGETVRVAFPQSEHPPITGALLGLDASGALRLGTPPGTRLLHAGEVTLDVIA